ncbi:MAG: carbohydrate binding domain-containing protein, partial [Planctomycetota bacterium]|nr:carbohydrate binding domain-containing protein [Planctomycetota bacterium]
TNTFEDTTTVEEIVDTWSAPFRNNLGGELPGGFDAIAIDELHSCPDGTPASNNTVAALRQLRAQYPNKLIFVSAVWKLAFSGHRKQKGILYDAQLAAVNQCADLLFMEAYLSETNLQLNLFDAMAKNINARAPGLLKKTIFGLGIPQNRPFPYGDCSPYVEFGDYLDAQIHRIKNSPLTRNMPGIGYWVYYRARGETVIHTSKLTDHYYVKGHTDYYGDGNYSSWLTNPSFEEATAGWDKNSTTSAVVYGNVDDLPNYHGAKFATHQNKAAKMVRGASSGYLAQVATVEPNTTYCLSAWVTGATAKSTFNAGLKVADARGSSHFEAGEEFLNLKPKGTGTKRWQRLSLRFTSESDTQQVRIMLHDSPAVQGSVLYWDFVELEQSYELPRTSGATPATGPRLEPKAYEVGIAPSHITKSTAPLFERDADDWDEVRRNIDFYKVYSTQAVPPKWASQLPTNTFAAFVKKHGIAVDAEFGKFRLCGGAGEGRAAAERAQKMHAWLGQRGLKLRALHLDGPIRRLMGCPGKEKDGMKLGQAAEETAVFLSECRKAFPGTRIGLITNFPNWHYTPEHPGMLGTWTNSTGVHYRDVLEAVYLAARENGNRIDFVEVDCPLNYYRATRNRSESSRPVNNAAKFKALQQWCKERDIEFWLIVNYDTNPQKVAGKPKLGNRLFHDQTLAYIRRLYNDGVFPDGFTIQSWYKLPEEHLPEEGGYSFMHTARDAIRLIRKLFPEEK